MTAVAPLGHLGRQLRSIRQNFVELSKKKAIALMDNGVDLHTARAIWCDFRLNVRKRSGVMASGRRAAVHTAEDAVSDMKKQLGKTSPVCWLSKPDVPANPSLHLQSY